MRIRLISESDSNIYLENLLVLYSGLVLRNEFLAPDVVLLRQMYHLHSTQPCQHLKAFLIHKISLLLFFYSNSGEEREADIIFIVFSLSTSVSLQETGFSCLASGHNHRN